jgi:hypothetical protein
MTAGPFIPKPESQRRKARRLNRLIAQAERVHIRMRRGAVLHKRSGGAWWLSDGTPVSAETAELVVKSVNVVGNGDGLFPGIHQTWRWAARE